LVPQRSVQFLQGVQSVLVVGPDDRVVLRTVDLGERYQDFFIVNAGLKPGDKVVVEGVQKAIPGRQVQPMAEPLSRSEQGAGGNG
jgi:membrane fusion protein (multidrug efflux system)